MKRLVPVLLLLGVCGVASVSSATDPPKRRAVRIPANSSIDAHIDTKLAANNIVPAAIAGDEEFLRRVTVDLTGTIPTSNEVESFLADHASDKRAKKIDALLASGAFTDRWTLWFGDLVQNVQNATNAREYYIGRNAYYNWIRASIAAKKPYDAMVRELLAGEGNSFESGVANYIVRQIQRNGPPQDTFDNLAAHSAEKFLGIPFLCLSCHDGKGHLELVNWYLRGKSRSDFWKMAAFFSRTTARGVRYDDPALPNANIIRFDVTTNPLGVYRLNTTDGNKSPRAPTANGGVDTVTPAFITTGETPKAGEPYRVAYARMLTADRQFARATVNYLWKEMFGTGLVEPVNAFDLTKLDFQPSHPQLLEDLATQFIASNYDLRAMLRTIALSSAYQRSAQYNGAHPDVTYFARRNPRRLTAEVLLDAVASATAVPFRFNVQGIGAVTKAVQLPDPLEARRQSGGVFMSNFGRGNRDDVMRTNDTAISQALSMMNDPVITQRVRRTNNSTVQQILASTSDPAVIVDKLYLATLSRHPTAAERTLAVDYLRAGTLNERTEDLQFALLNSVEFLFV
jgi:hypothetical protein